jgi:hypothetical protein
VQALSGRLIQRFAGYFGGSRTVSEEEAEKLMDNILADQMRFWVSIMTETATKTQTPLTELKKMDVFEFFSLVSVVEEKNSKKK